MVVPRDNLNYREGQPACIYWSSLLNTTALYNWSSDFWRPSKTVFVYGYIYLVALSVIKIISGWPGSVSDHALTWITQVLLSYISTYRTLYIDLTKRCYHNFEIHRIIGILQYRIAVNFGTLSRTGKICCCLLYDNEGLSIFNQWLRLIYIVTHYIKMGKTSWTHKEGLYVTIK